MSWGPLLLPHSRDADGQESAPESNRNHLPNTTGEESVLEIIAGVDGIACHAPLQHVPESSHVGGIGDVGGDGGDGRCGGNDGKVATVAT